ncbi:MAG: hypothetical protein WCW17_01135 [Patescibacteria group bacterium]
MLNILKKIYIKNKLLVIFTLVLVFYLISLATESNITMAIFGLPLLLYFPGKFIIEIIPPMSFKFGKFGKFSLSIIYSFCLACVLGLILQNSLEFNSGYQVTGFILLNIILFIINYLILRSKFWRKTPFSSKKISNRSYTAVWCDYTTIALFAVAILIIILLNPLAQNYDKYLAILKLSVSQNFNLLASRQIFISFTFLVSKISGLNISIVDRNIYDGLFFFSTLIFYDYLKRNLQSRLIISLSYLSFLIPPVILMQVDITIPQVVLVILTTPVLILAIESIKYKNTLAAITAFSISITAILFHQLSAVLVAIAVITLGINLWKLIFIDKKILWKHIILFSIITIACFVIFDLWNLFLPSVLILKSAYLSFANINWRWWFINRYLDIDGTIIMFSGINALFYYLYNGVLLLLLLAYLYCFICIKRIKIERYVLPPVLYLIFFFVVAEVLPRIGLFFLPNRAWLHMMIPAVILSALFLEKIEITKLKIKFIPIILIVFICTGYAGSLYLIKNNIKKVYREELPTANFIKNNTPVDSIILSSQDNLALVYIYGNRNYGQTTTDHIINKNEFVNLIDTELEELSKNINKTIRPKLNKTIENISTINGSVYFLYSYRKLNILNNGKIDRQEVDDSLNESTYRNFEYPVVYSDKNAFLIKIK